MPDFVEEIFSRSNDRSGIVDAVRANLGPILQERKGRGETEMFTKLCLCIGYHIRKVEILKSIVFTFFKHHTIKKNVNKQEISAAVDGIISCETDAGALIETAKAYHSQISFNSDQQRDALYLTTCMKLIIEGSLLAGFIEDVGTSQNNSLLSLSPDTLTEMFNTTLKRYTDENLRGIISAI